MRLRARILVPAGISLAATVVIGATAAWAMHHIGSMLEASTHHELETYNRTLRLKASLGELQAFAYRQVTLAGSLSGEQLKKARTSIATELSTQRQELQYLQPAGYGEPEVTGALSTALVDLDKYAKTVDQAIDMASVDPNTGIASMQTADELFHRNAERLDKIVENRNSALQAALTSIGATRTQMALVDLVVALAAIAATISLSLIAMRRIMADIAKCSEVADSVARGELSASQVKSHTQEIGALLDNLEQMKASLRDVVGQVRSGVQSMASATREIAEGNEELSRRTEQQASNLDTTSASMDKMVNAIERSADFAKQAESLAQSATAVATRGGEVVGEVVQQMTEIESSSQKIAEIITVIDGIAFQTNILALNASVEAARAGAQGRGFAVVAGEVRELAQRSALAARQIKELISRSVEKVESGSRLVHSAGMTMTDIVSQVLKVSGLIAEITAAAHVQNTDAEAANRAVEQIESMTQQNAHLAQQSAAAAQTLRQHSAKLAAAVSLFKMPSALEDLTSA